MVVQQTSCVWSPRNRIDLCLCVCVFVCAGSYLFDSLLAFAHDVPQDCLRTALSYLPSCYDDLLYESGCCSLRCRAAIEKVGSVIRMHQLGVYDTTGMPIMMMVMMVQDLCMYLHLTW